MSHSKKTLQDEASRTLTVNGITLTPSAVDQIRELQSGTIPLHIRQLNTLNDLVVFYSEQSPESFPDGAIPTLQTISTARRLLDSLQG